MAFRDLVVTWGGKVAGIVAATTALVALINNYEAIAEAQPFATKSWVQAENSLVVEILRDMQWDQTIDRHNLLDYQIGQLLTLKVLLKGEIAVETDPQVKAEKEVRLEALESDIDYKVAERAELKCRIDNRGTSKNGCSH